MKKKSKSDKNFPQQLYVHIDIADNDPIYIADYEIRAAPDESLVAIYELREVKTKTITHSLK